MNRIFTDKTVGRAMANFDSNSHFINIKHDRSLTGRLQGYAYLFDFKNSVANSVATYGLRMNGGLPLTETIKGIYTAEYSLQDGYGNNLGSIFVILY